MPDYDDRAVGLRLRDLRVTDGLSQAQVAAALDIPRSAVSLIESGERALASSELARLNAIYGWPIEFILFGGENEEATLAGQGGEVVRYFRSTGALAPVGEKWLTQAEKKWQIYADLEARVHGSQRWELPVYPTPRGRPIEQGERLAEQERRRLGQGSSPIRSMIGLLEGEGVKVLVIPFPSAAGVAGAYFFSNELGPCVVVNKTDPPSRRRFTEAHEYCHFLVDRGPQQGEICRHERANEPFEMRANAFAAGLLMPPRGIAESLEENDVQSGEVGPEDLVHLMYRFGVSYDAILWRLVNLRFITLDERKALSRYSPVALRKQLGYKLEPGESESAPDRFQRLAIDAWRLKQISARELSGILGLPIGDLKKALGSATSKTPRRGPRRALADPEWL